MIKSDPLAKLDMKAKDIDRQILNNNRMFKASEDHSLWGGYGPHTGNTQESLVQRLAHELNK